MDLHLRGRVVLITGGTDGLGLALARVLLAEGAQVAVCGRNVERLTAVQRELGDRALCVAADVTVPDELDRFIDRTLERFGQLDGVVSNAGRSAATPIERATAEEWRADFDLKVLPLVHLARRTAGALAETHGSILAVLSVLAKAPGANSTPTSASRAAGLAVIKSLAAELGPHQVRANAILIGLIESGQWVRRAEASGTELSTFYGQLAAASPIPLGRVGRAEEFAAVAAFLLSPKAGYVTGVGLNLDGGLSPVP